MLLDRPPFDSAQAGLFCWWFELSYNLKHLILLILLVLRFFKFVNQETIIQKEWNKTDNAKK